MKCFSLLGFCIFHTWLRRPVILGSDTNSSSRFNRISSRLCMLQHVFDIDRVDLSPRIRGISSEWKKSHKKRMSHSLVLFLIKNITRWRCLNPTWSGFLRGRAVTSGTHGSLQTFVFWPELIVFRKPNLSRFFEAMIQRHPNEGEYIFRSFSGESRYNISFSRHPPVRKRESK